MKEITIPTGKWTIKKIEELAKIFLGFGKLDKMKPAENMSIACSSIFAEYDNKKLTLKEIRQFTSAFNKLREIKNPKRDAIKKHLIMEALLISKHIANIKIKGLRIAQALFLFF